MSLSRRDLLRVGIASPLALAAARIAWPLPGFAAEGTVRSADEALDRLMAGNRRFVATQAQRPNQSADVRVKVAGGQLPFAIIFGCSDSRVPPEIVFDQGLGDLFVIRVAGHVLDETALASIEFAVDEFKPPPPLVMVLGHERCGAVTAAVHALTAHEEAMGHLGALVEPIKMAAEQVRGAPGDAVDNAVRANVALVVSQLEDSEPILAEKVDADELLIVGARYDLDTGAVDLIA